MARRLSSPVFIGRSNELSALGLMAAAATSGHPSFAIVGGEAGVGKSRLVAEIGGQLRTEGWLVVEGGSVPLGDDSLPFGPIVEALRSLVRLVGAGQIALAAGPSLSELARLVPELSGVADGSATSVGEPEWLQIRIFEGVLRLLGRLAETAPILLVVEDLHWSDRSTRDLLSYMARNVRDERLFIVATIRTDELRRQHPIKAWLAEAERQGRVERIDLQRFNRDELVELLTAIVGSAPARLLVDPIGRRSGGNAFFAEELLAATDDTRQGGQHLPETLRGVLLVRLSDMSETATQLIEIAAVAGRQVDHEVLAEVCGLSDVEMRTALHEAVGAQLLVADLERYQFRHALVQEAAYDELLPSERRVLHAAYARAIEARPAGAGAIAASRLIELAHHWMAAQDPTRALIASIEAGDVSRTVYADAEAVGQYERAIELWDIVPASDRPIGRDLADLYDAASDVAWRVGDASRAVFLARRELELVDNEPAPDSKRRARARERLSLASWLAGDTEGSIDLAEQAAALYAEVPRSSGHARVLSALAANLMLAGRSSESIPFAERAIEGARTNGDQATEARGLDILGVDLATLGNIAGGIELLRNSIAITNPVDDPNQVVRGHANLGAVLEMGGLVDEALRVWLAGEEGTKHAARDPRLAAFLELNAAGLLVELGRYPEAAALLEQNVGRLLPGPTTIHFHVIANRLAFVAGDLPTARRHLEIARTAARGAVEDPQFLVDFYASSTELALWDGDPAGALVLARAGFDRVVEIGFAMILGQLVLPAAHAAADLAVRARAAGDPTEAEAMAMAARVVIERYRASTERLTMADALMIREIDWRLALCAAELARADGKDDPVKWESVQPALAARPAPFLEAYVLWRRAEALAGQGRINPAALPLREARAVAIAIGAPLLVARIEASGQRLRIDLASPDLGAARAAAKPQPIAPADPFGLSKREREVLPLVAKGFTNRRIADALFISESTAGVHVSHILGKLGVDSRTEAAAVAVRLGLDRAPTSS